MNTVYAISPDHRYRRESFGGLVFDCSSKETRFFNHAGAVAIERFAAPTGIAAAHAELQGLFETPDALARFIRDIADKGIIRPKIAPGQLGGRTFFTDVVAFEEDRLYSPLGVAVELTQKCQRRCAYCAYESSPQIDTAGELDRTTLRDILGLLADAGVFYIRFSGGDPLTRRDAFDILSDADELRFAITFASDLTTFTKQDASRLARIENLVALQTTLDGPEPETADKLRGNGNFKRVTEAIPLLRDAGVDVIVGMILTKLNCRLVYKTAELLGRWNVLFHPSPLYDAGRARALRSLVPGDDDLAEAYEQFAAAVEEGLVRPADRSWDALAQPLSAAARSRLWSGQPWLLRSPDRELRIDPRGRCYTSIHLKNVLADDVYVGTLPGADLIELWHSAPLLRKLRAARTHNGYFGDVIDIRNMDETRGLLR